MPPEVFIRAVDRLKDRFPERAGLRTRLVQAVSSCADKFDSTLYANGLTIGKLDGGYFVEIREYRYPPPPHGETQKIDEERFRYTDRLVVKGNSVSMYKISSDQVSSYKSLSREKADSIIYMLGVVKRFNPIK